MSSLIAKPANERICLRSCEGFLLLSLNSGSNLSSCQPVKFVRRSNTATSWTILRSKEETTSLYFGFDEIERLLHQQEPQLGVHAPEERRMTARNRLNADSMFLRFISNEGLVATFLALRFSDVHFYTIWVPSNAPYKENSLVVHV